VFIELAEYLRCPNNHEDVYLVLATGAMKGRAIRYGTLGCPACRAEFLVVQQTVKFGAPPPVTAPSTPLPPPDAVNALLALDSPGGYVSLVGSATGLAQDLAGYMRGVHFVCVNAAQEITPSITRSLTESTATIPLRSAVARGVVLGGEYALPGWLAEAARVVLRGQRVVVLTETVSAPDGVRRLASGRGMWVGQKDG